MNITDVPLLEFIAYSFLHGVLFILLFSLVLFISFIFFIYPRAVMLFVMRYFFSKFVYKNMLKSSEKKKGETPEILTKKTEPADESADNFTGKRDHGDLVIRNIDSFQDVRGVNNKADNLFNRVYNSTHAAMNKIYKAIIKVPVTTSALILLFLLIIMISFGFDQPLDSGRKSNADYSLIRPALILLLYLMYLLIKFGVFMKGFRQYYRSRKKTLENNKLLILRTYGSKENTRFLFDTIAERWHTIGSTFTIMDPIYAKYDLGLLFMPRIFKFKVFLLLTYVFSYLLLLTLGLIIGAYFEKYSAQNASQPFIIITEVSLTIIILIICIAVILYLFTSILFTRNTQKLITAVNKPSNYTLAMDGRFKQIGFYCFDNIWKKALSMLVQKADVVLMDLRGYTSDNKGCEYEMGYLVNNFDVSRVVILVNEFTDKEIIERTLEREWKTMKETSPNSGIPNPQIVMYQSIRSGEKNSVSVKDTENILKLLTNCLA